MAYHKRPLRPITCANCGTPFEAAHKTRRYCSSSCNTLAWRARRARPASEPGGQEPPARSAGASPLPAPLDWNWQNVGVIAAGAALGQLAVQAGTHVVQELRQPVPALVAGPAGPVWLTPLAYRGRRFHFSAAHALLFAETTDGGLVSITSPSQLNAVAPPEGVQRLVNRFLPALPPAPDRTIDPAPEQPPGPG